MRLAAVLSGTFAQTAAIMDAMGEDSTLLSARARLLSPLVPTPPAATVPIDRIMEPLVVEQPARPLPPPSQPVKTDVTATAFPIGYVGPVAKPNIAPPTGAVSVTSSEGTASTAVARATQPAVAGGGVEPLIIVGAVALLVWALT